MTSYTGNLTLPAGALAGINSALIGHFRFDKLTFCSALKTNSLGRFALRAVFKQAWVRAHLWNISVITVAARLVRLVGRCLGVSAYINYAPIWAFSWVYASRC